MCKKQSWENFLELNILLFSSLFCLEETFHLWNIWSSQHTEILLAITLSVYIICTLLYCTLYFIVLYFVLKCISVQCIVMYCTMFIRVSNSEGGWEQEVYSCCITNLSRRGGGYPLLKNLYLKPLVLLYSTLICCIFEKSSTHFSLQYNAAIHRPQFSRCIMPKQVFNVPPSGENFGTMCF